MLAHVDAAGDSLEARRPGGVPGGQRANDGRSSLEAEHPKPEDPAGRPIESAPKFTASPPKNRDGSRIQKMAPASLQRKALLIGPSSSGVGSTCSVSARPGRGAGEGIAVRSGPDTAGRSASDGTGGSGSSCQRKRGTGRGSTGVSAASGAGTTDGAGAGRERRSRVTRRRGRRRPGRARRDGSVQNVGGRLRRRPGRRVLGAPGQRPGQRRHERHAGREPLPRFRSQLAIQHRRDSSVKR